MSEGDLAKYRKKDCERKRKTKVLLEFQIHMLLAIFQQYAIRVTT